VPVNATCLGVLHEDTRQWVISKPLQTPSSLSIQSHYEREHGQVHRRATFTSFTDAHDSCSFQGKYIGESGIPYPPCIIVERGEALDEFVRRHKPDFPTVLQILGHVAERMRQLHSEGYVHRDLKPANILWRPRSYSWTLIDFGCAARIGAALSPAPPPFPPFLSP
jgi:hypothetical protein